MLSIQSTRALGAAGFTHSAMAQRLGIPVGTTLSGLHEARKQVRRVLNGEPALTRTGPRRK